MKRERKIIFHEHHFQDFYLQVNDVVREKIGYVFRVIETVGRVPEKFLKHIEGTNGLFEIRIELGSNIYRIFCCFEKDNLVVLFNGFQKKTRKTPKQQIDLAAKLREEYFALKEKLDEKGRSDTKC